MEGLVRPRSESDQQRLLANIMAGLPGAFDRYDIPGLRAHARPLPRGEPAAPARQPRALPARGDPGRRGGRGPDRDPSGRSAASADGPAADRLERRRSRLHHRGGRLARQRAHAVQRLARRGSQQRRAGDRPALRRRIHFAHLRNVRKEPDGSFMEADHLGGDTDMVALVGVLLGGAAAPAGGRRPALAYPVPARPRPRVAGRCRQADPSRLPASGASRAWPNCAASSWRSRRCAVYPYDTLPNRPDRLQRRLL